jgi:hypothetical protein
VQEKDERSTVANLFQRIIPLSSRQGDGKDVLVSDLIRIKNYPSAIIGLEFCLCAYT